jgi:transcriptional regulator with XRE-family HTH domain
LGKYFRGGYVSKPRPSALGAVLRFFRFANGLSEAEAADLFGMRPALLSQLERGEEGTLSRARLEELLARLDVPPDAIDHALYSLGVGVAPEPSASSVDPTPAQRRIIRRAAVGAGQGALESTEEKLTENVRRMMSGQARAEAATSWETLRELPPRRRRLAVETERRYWSWALAERLCEESERAAAHRASEAVELSRLGLRAAELAPETEPWRSRLLGWVWAFVANARRVQGDLPGAEEGFQRSDRLLEAGGAAGPVLLDGTRPLDLKATLRRYQGRFDEALVLLEQAFKVDSSQEARGRILVKKAHTLRHMGDLGKALAELRRAEILLKSSQDPRLVFVVKHSLAHSLWQLGQFREVEARLPEARRRAVETGNELDLIRTLWVEGGVSAGLGREEQARRSLEQVRRYFNAHRIGYDAALVSLELAVLYLEDERSLEVKKLSEEMFWIFKAQGVHREALTALRLFYEAARNEEATAELARGVVDYLKKARYHPELRFDL